MLNEEGKQQQENDLLDQKVDIVFQFNYFTCSNLINSYCYYTIMDNAWKLCNKMLNNVISLEARDILI